MPFKFHASRRHHIPRAKYRVMNWPDYDRGLVRRGDIRFWIDESALEQWDAAKRRTPGGQRRFSELAISTTLMLGVVFRLPLRQTEGFVRSLVDLMGCDLPVPDHTTLSRRRRTVDVVVETSTNKRSTDIVLDSTGLKFFGAGEWARAKHGETRRSWRKLHISVDPASSEIRTHELTGDDTADATMAGPLVAGSGGMIRRVFADGAYDGEPVTKAIREARPPDSPPEIIIPPRATSIPPPDTPHGGSEREHHAAEIASIYRARKRCPAEMKPRAGRQTISWTVCRRNLAATSSISGWRTIMWRRFTTAGSTLVLMRFADAVAALEGAGGLRVHRSYWVAKKHVTGTVRCAATPGPHYALPAVTKRRSVAAIFQPSVRPD